VPAARVGHEDEDAAGALAAAGEEGDCGWMERDGMGWMREGGREGHHAAPHTPSKQLTARRMAARPHAEGARAAGSGELCVWRKEVRVGTSTPGWRASGSLSLARPAATASPGRRPACLRSHGPGSERQTPPASPSSTRIPAKRDLYSPF